MDHWITRSCISYFACIMSVLFLHATYATKLWAADEKSVWSGESCVAKESLMIHGISSQDQAERMATAFPGWPIAKNSQECEALHVCRFVRYYKDGVLLIVENSRSGSIIREIDVRSAKYKLLSGVHVGMRREEVFGVIGIKDIMQENRIASFRGCNADSNKEIKFYFSEDNTELVGIDILPFDYCVPSKEYSINNVHPGMSIEDLESIKGRAVSMESVNDIDWMFKHDDGVIWHEPLLKYKYDNMNVYVALPSKIVVFVSTNFPNCKTPTGLAPGVRYKDAMRLLGINNLPQSVHARYYYQQCKSREDDDSEITIVFNNEGIIEALGMGLSNTELRNIKYVIPATSAGKD